MKSHQPIGWQAQAQCGRIRQALVNATLIRGRTDAAVYVGTDDGVEIELVIVGTTAAMTGAPSSTRPTARRQR